MSHNQSTAQRNESTQYRKYPRSGSFNQQRHFSGSGSTKGGGAPSNHNFKKYNSNTQGGQSGPRIPNASSDSSTLSAARPVQNSAHQQQTVHGASIPPVANTTTSFKQTDAPTQKVTRDVPRPPSSVVSTVAPSSNASSDSKSPTTPAKAPGDASRSFPLQFGSISPSFMNGMQVPARTTSAPPNLDEQKRDQARRDSLRATPAMPSQSVLKQQLPKKDVGVLDQLTNTIAAQPLSKSKRDVQVLAAPPVSQTQKPSVHPIPRMPVPMSFHQQQTPVQFGDPNHQMQSQALSGMPMPVPMPMPIPMPMPMPMSVSMSMSMPLSMGSPPLQQPMFVPGLQPRPMQPSGMMHQGQNFSSQMNQLPQLGNMGINMPPQFHLQHVGKFSGTRKTVKITHPETHEELRLDGSSAQRAHSANHSMNFYPNSYNANSLFFPPSSVPLNSNQLPSTSQPPWFYNQVTVKPAGGSHGEKDQVQSTSSPSIGKGESLKPSRAHGEDSVRLQKKFELSSSSSLQPFKHALGTSSTSAPTVGKHSTRVAGPITVERATSNTPTPDSVWSGICQSASISFGEETRKEICIGPNSIEDRKLGNEGLKDKVGMQSSSVLSSPSQVAEPEPLEAEATSSGSSVMLETSKDLPSTTISVVVESSDLRSDIAEESTQNFDTKTAKSREAKRETRGKKNMEDVISSERSKADKCNLESSLKSLSLESSEIINKIEECSSHEVSFSSQDDNLLESAHQTLEESSGFCADNVVADNLVTSTSMPDGGNAESALIGLSAQCDKTSASDASLRVHYNIDIDKEVAITNSSTICQDSEPDSVSSHFECVLKTENEGAENNNRGFISLPSGVREKVFLEPNAAKNTMPRAKKKLKELYRKAEAAVTISDLYMAYKRPEEKKETVTSIEITESTSNNSVKKKPVNVTQDNAMSRERPSQSEAEPDDWEDAADKSTPKLETSMKEKQVNEGDDYGLTTKKYSRDFLLKFVEQCTDLPEGFEITSDLAEALMVSSIIGSRESYPGPGRNVDRPTGGSRPDRRGIGMGDEDKWGRLTGLLVSGQGDVRMNFGYAGNVMGLRPSQGGNYGVLRNPRAQTPVQYNGGILSGPMQALPPHGVLQRNTSDSDRWQSGTAFQKGLTPYPQTPLQVMHKAETKYEVGKVTDEEEAKQRQLKAILNKLTPQNFEKLFEQVKQVNIDNAVTLSGVIAQIFDKALMEPTFCEMYANFCYHLAAELPDLSVGSERITFKRLLLNKCQEEFERGEREEEEAKKADEEGEAKQSEEEREEKRIQARRRMLGNIRLIGELYKKRMLTEKIMHECIRKLLGQYHNPDEEDVEALCKLMSTIGEMIDHPRAKEYMDAYFDMMAPLSNNMKLSSRVRFMLKDTIDLRKNKWQQRRKVEGPKKIEEVHRDAAQERQAQSSRMSRAPSIGTAVRRVPHMDFAPRGPSLLSSPSPQMGGYRAVTAQLRGCGSQDVRPEERHSFENRTMSISLTQRPVGDDNITLGPQGGLARGMAFGGQPSAPNIPLSEMLSPGDARRMGPDLNRFSSMPERAAYGKREDHAPRHIPDRFTSPSNYEQSYRKERNITPGNRDVINKDRGFDRSLPTPTRCDPPTSMPNKSSEKVGVEEHLQNMSMAAVKEFYSANDENEVALCIKDLNAPPSFYPLMICDWVNDSFERKDVDRDLLTKLLINLAKPQNGIISRDHLIKGFESVLGILEDTVNDAPKAAEFLGRILAKVILENVISFSEIGQLIYEGGEEQGRLVEIGLAAKVLGSILETINSEKGGYVLSEICSNSNVLLENFRPPGSNKSLSIDKFM